MLLDSETRMPLRFDLSAASPIKPVLASREGLVAIALIAHTEGSPVGAVLFAPSGAVIHADKWEADADTSPESVLALPVFGTAVLSRQIESNAARLKSVALNLEAAGVVGPPGPTPWSWMGVNVTAHSLSSMRQHLVARLVNSATLQCATVLDADCVLAAHDMLHAADKVVDGL